MGSEPKDNMDVSKVSVGAKSHLPELLPGDPVGVVDLVRNGAGLLPGLHSHERVVSRAGCLWQKEHTGRGGGGRGSHQETIQWRHSRLSGSKVLRYILCMCTFTRVIPMHTADR